MICRLSFAISNIWVSNVRYLSRRYKRFFARFKYIMCGVVGYKKICKMLNNEDVKNEEKHDEYLRNNFLELCEKIKFSELLKFFIERETIRFVHVYIIL